MIRLGDISLEDEEARKWFGSLDDQQAEQVASLAALRAFLVTLAVATRRPQFDLIHWRETHADIRLMLFLVRKIYWPWRPTFSAPPATFASISDTTLDLTLEVRSKFATYSLENANSVERVHWFEALKFAALALADFSSSQESEAHRVQEAAKFAWSNIIEHARDDAQDLKSRRFTEVASPLFTSDWLMGELHLVWQIAVAKHHNDPPEGPRFQYWRDWYRGLLAGKPLDWELQRRVALIDDAIWDAGPEAVAQEIARIEAEFLSEKLPLAETVELNPDTGRFRVVPIPVQNPPLMSALLTQISDALEDALQGANGLSDRSSEYRKITRAVTRYGNNPQQAELTLTVVAKGLRRQIHDTGELPDSEDNIALLEAVEEGARGIRANHPEVAANREQLARQALSELSTEDKALLEQAAPVLIEISEGEMAEDFAEDIPALVNDALLPLPSGAPPLPGADSATRIFSRVSRMAMILDGSKKMTRKGAKAFDSDLVKTVRLAGLTISVAGGVGGLLYALVQIGLRIFGVF